METVFRGTQCGYDTRIEIDPEGEHYHLEQSNEPAEPLETGNFSMMILEAGTLYDLLAGTQPEGSTST